MKWIEQKILYDDQPHLPFTELLVDAFYRFGITGVVIEDPCEPVPVGDLGADLCLPERHAVSGYFPNALETILPFEAEVHRIARRNGFEVSMLSRPVDEEDWAESWKAFFHPERIGERLVVKPSWRDFEALPGDLVLEIDPGMAFGTGTHPTTAMCLRLLEKRLEPGWRVMDVGCGSGILMLAATALGAERVVGVDRDPVAAAIARENLVRNRVPGERFDVVTGSLLDAVRGVCDLIVANILAEVIVDLLEAVPALLKPGGLFIGSGIIREQARDIQEAAERNGLHIRETVTEDQWIAVLARSADPG